MSESLGKGIIFVSVQSIQRTEVTRFNSLSLSLNFLAF